MPRGRQPTPPLVVQHPGSGQTRPQLSRAEVRQYRQPQMIQTSPVQAMTASERKKVEEKKKKKKDLKIAKKR